MKTLAKIGVAVLCVGLMQALVTGAEKVHELKTYKGSEQFERMKGLAGVWKGTSDMGKGEQEVVIEYYVTSAGSALVEKLFPGMPHEMISIYHDKGDKLSMTHYCSLHNQPQLELKKSGKKKLQFKLSKTSTIDPKEYHMNSLTILFKDENNIIQEWVSYKNGKEENTHITKLKRVIKEEQEP